MSSEKTSVPSSASTPASPKDSKESTKLTKLLVVATATGLDLMLKLGVKTSSTPRGNSEGRSYLTMCGTWLHRVWCALASIVLGVPELVGGSEKVGGAWLSCKANRREVKTKGSSRRG